MTSRNEVATKTNSRVVKKKELFNINDIPFLANLNIKGHLDKRKFLKTWQDRNYYYGEVFLKSSEVDYIYYLQYYFVEDNKSLAEKLERTGFVEQPEFPGEVYFNKFSRMLYNKKYNIALTLYKPAYKHAITTALEIVADAEIDGQVGLDVFLSTVNVLIKQ